MISAIALLLVVATDADAGARVTAALTAAQGEVDRRVRYDVTQRYRRLTFSGGKRTRRPVYPAGDIDPTEGVCTDLVIRALRAAGIDLQRLVHEDIRRAPKAYRLNRWRQKRPDPNIDHRRVPNLLTYFRRHAKLVANDTDLAPGDVVIWDLSSRGVADHTGIVSARRADAPDAGAASSRPLIFHNYPDPGYTTLADVLAAWRVVARFRVIR